MVIISVGACDWKGQWTEKAAVREETHKDSLDGRVPSFINFTIALAFVNIS